MPIRNKLSIIIVNFRSLDPLMTCLNSLFNGGKKLPRLFEVIVVNNDDSSDFCDLLKEFPQIKLIDHKKNIGFGAGCNLGAKEAMGEWLWFLNPDTQLIDDVGSIFEFGEVNSWVGAMSPRLVDNGLKTQKWGLGTSVTLWDIVLNNLGIVRSQKLWRKTVPTACAWVSGASLIVSRKLFWSLGGFDEKFFMYFEDVDLCKRIINSGKKIIYFPSVRIKHIGGLSRQSEKEQKSQFYESQAYFFKKHLPNWQYKALKWLRKLTV